MEEEKSLKYYVGYPDSKRYSFELSIQEKLHIVVYDNYEKDYRAFTLEINLDEAMDSPF